MKSLLAILSLMLLFLVGCASTVSVMESWVGQPESKLLTRYGAPDAQTQLTDGSKVYTWKRVWYDANGVPQIGRQNFVVSAAGVITDWSANNIPRTIRADIADSYAAAPLGAKEQTGKNWKLYGGPDHKTYLGCLTCNDNSSDSIWNRMGSKGSIYTTKSIWKSSSQFGSTTSQYSPWNATADDPPVVVDESGKSYGRFTINKNHPDFPTNEELRRLIDKATARRLNKI